MVYIVIDHPVAQIEDDSTSNLKKDDFKETVNSHMMIRGEGEKGMLEDSRQGIILLVEIPLSIKIKICRVLVLKLIQ